MKVLHLITSLGIGGAETMLHNLLQQPAMTGESSRVVSLIEGGEMSMRIRELGIPVQTLKMKPGKFDSRALLQLIAILRKDPPDMMQTWMYHADLLGGIAGKLAGNIPVVWGIHHTAGAMKRSTRAVVRLNARLSAWLPKRIICCATSACQAHLQTGYAKGKMIIIPNGIDTNCFKPDDLARVGVRRELGLIPDSPLIGMFARFHPQKDYHTFSEAAGEIHRRLPEVHFLLAGEGMTPGNTDLNDWFHSAGIGKNVHLLGLRQDIPRLMASLDIGTLTSAYGEALPLALLEMMACGLPCAVTAVGDSGVVVNGSGKVVPPGEATLLARSWEELLRLGAGERKVLGEQARSIVETGYNIRTTAEKYLYLYRSSITPP